MTNARADAEFTRIFFEKLKDARERTPQPGLIAQVAMYCENQSCMVRRVEIEIKEEPGEEGAKIDVAPKCPVCGGVLNTHGFSIRGVNY